MVIFKKTPKHGDLRWRTRFAFFPITIEVDELKGSKTIVFFGFYESQYKYCGNDLGWIFWDKRRLKTNKEKMKYENLHI